MDEQEFLVQILAQLEHYWTHSFLHAGLELHSYEYAQTSQQPLQVALLKVNVNFPIFTNLYKSFPPYNVFAVYLTMNWVSGL